MIRFGFTRRIRGIAVLSLPIMLGLTLGLTWFYRAQANPPLVDLVVVVALGVFLTALVTAVAVVAFTNIGIVKTDEGILVFEASFLPRVAFQRPIRWSEMQSTRVADSFGETILRVAGPPVTLSPAQGRAVLLDERCPLKPGLTPESLRNMGVT